MSLWLVGVVASFSGSADAASFGSGDLETLNKSAAFAFSVEGRDSSDYESKKHGMWAPLVDCPLVSSAVVRSNAPVGELAGEALSRYRQAACGMLFGRAPPRASVG